MDTATCKNCDKPIIRDESVSPWLHYPSMLRECTPRPVAQPRRDADGNVIELLTK